MIRLVFALLIGLTLVVVATSSAFANQPDNQACAHANSRAVTEALSGLGCVGHP